MTAQDRRCFVPPHVADRLEQEIGHPAAAERVLRERRELFVASGGTATATAPADVVVVYDSANQEQTNGSRFQVPYSDARAVEADTGINATLTVLALLNESFGKNGLNAYVHYGSRYDNAFWDGAEMCFGDGDGRVFGPFTRPIDVCAHELGHGVTGDLLAYHDQPGALNESMSDCQGAAVRQHALGLGVHDDGAWLIGAKSDLFLPAFTGRALRDMLNPGTAYKNDPLLGSDPQPADMAHYVQTTSDDGGVHINSGIPNKAFALAASSIGDSVATLGIWRAALGAVNDPECTFAKFAEATVTAAGSHATVIRGAWVTVGVLKATSPTPQPPPGPVPGPVPTPGGGTPSSDGPFPGADPAVVPKLAKVAARAGLSVTDWMNWHFKKYFGIR